MTLTMTIVEPSTKEVVAPANADGNCKWIVANNAPEELVHDLWNTLQGDAKLEFRENSDYRESRDATSGTRGFQNSFGFDERKTKLVNSRAVFKSTKHGYHDGIEVDRCGRATGRVKIALPQQYRTTLQRDCEEMAKTSMKFDENVTFHSVAWNMKECRRPTSSTAPRIVKNMRVVDVSATHYILAPPERSRE